MSSAAVLGAAPLLGAAVLGATVLGATVLGATLLSIPAPALAGGDPPYLSELQSTRTMVLTVDSRASLLVCSAGMVATHPRPREACKALVMVDGDVARLPARPEILCTMQYQPVSVTATGIWDGRLVRFEHTYGNPCTLRAEGGPVFAF